MFSFGSDPEFMLVKGGKYYSAINIVKGDIANRIKIDGHEFYWDNVLAECAIKPGFTKEETISNFRNCFQIYTEMVKPYKLVAQASEIYPASELADEKARNAGCAPDNCAYDIKEKKPKKGILSGTDLRTCGGHVHMGCDGEALHSDYWQCIVTVRLLDLFVGVPSLFIDHDPTSARRRVLYGKAGRFRPKPYGMEYRSLGNFWLASPKLVDLVYDLCKFTTDYVEEKKFNELYTFDEEMYWELPQGQLKKAYKCVGYKENELRKCLDTNDKNKARAFMKIASNEMPKELYKRIEEASAPTQYDFYKEWELE